MIRRTFLVCTVCFTWHVILGTIAAADPIAELRSFSVFKDVSIEKLAAGSVQSTRGPAMSFPRGMSMESIYLVRKPLQKSIELHLQWNATKSPELKVWLHTDLPSRPRPSDFQRLAAAPANASVKSFVAATQKLGSGSTDLQLSHAEAKNSPSGVTSGQGAGALPGNVIDFWSNVLAQRASAYVGGGTGRLAPYETAGPAIRPAEEIARLLKESEKVRGQFASLIDSTPLTGGKASLSPALYWEMSDVEGRAIVSLGALYARGGSQIWQAVDGQYYASGGYYVLLTFYQMWPIQVGGEDGTLVWRGDLISSDSLASLHGVERMGSSTAMLRGIKKSIESLLKDAAKSR
jgi:hypothetical protein